MEVSILSTCFSTILKFINILKTKPELCVLVVATWQNQLKVPLVKICTFQTDIEVLK